MKTMEELKREKEEYVKFMYNEKIIWIVMSAQKIKILIHGKIIYRVDSKIVGYIVT